MAISKHTLEWLVRMKSSPTILSMRLLMAMWRNVYDLLAVFIQVVSFFFGGGGGNLKTQKSQGARKHTFTILCLPLFGS